MRERILELLEEKINLLEELKESEYLEITSTAVETIVESLRNGGKILLAGNGGSAADAQHFAGEIVGRFLLERKAMPAISLCVDPSVMTCIVNDYGNDSVFERQLSALGNESDCFIAISTSGNSKNLINAVKYANKNNIRTIGLLGKGGGLLAQECEYSLVVPSDKTPRIQEIHTFTVHLMCEEIEKKMFL